MATIVLPTLFRNITQVQQIELPGQSVQEVISELLEKYPPLKQFMLTADNTLSPFINLYLNNQDVRYLAQYQTPINDKDTLAIIPAIAGG